MIVAVAAHLASGGPPPGARYLPDRWPMANGL